MDLVSQVFSSLVTITGWLSTRGAHIYSQRSFNQSSICAPAKYLNSDLSNLYTRSDFWWHPGACSPETHTSTNSMSWTK